MANGTYKQDVLQMFHLTWFGWPFYLFLFCYFFPCSIFPQPHLSSHFRSCMLLLTPCAAGFGFVWHSCDCVLLCVYTRIKPTSILRGRKAPLGPLGKGIPLEWVPPLEPIDSEADPFWFTIDTVVTGLLPHTCTCLCVCVCVSVTCLCHITTSDAAAVLCLCIYRVCCVWTVRGHCLSVQFYDF